jgi:hypothetical protein
VPLKDVDRVLRKGDTYRAETLLLRRVEAVSVVLIFRE